MCIRDSLNADLLSRLQCFDAEVRRVMPLAAALTVNDVLHWPGIFGDDALDVDALSPTCLALASEALDDFTASRAREGEKLAEVIREKLARTRALVCEVGPRIPAAQAAFNEKLRQRLLEAVEMCIRDRSSYLPSGRRSSTDCRHAGRLVLRPGQATGARRAPDRRSSGRPPSGRRTNRSRRRQCIAPARLGRPASFLSLIHI